MRLSRAFHALGTLAAWAPLVAARPLVVPKPVPSPPAAIESRSGGCKPNIFIFARGTGEPGSMGFVVGPPVTKALKKALGDHAVAAEGVKYSAGVAGNMSPGGDPAGVSMMKKQVTKAATECPESNILVGGYSQGAGLAHHAVQGLSAPVKERVAGVVLFGDPSLMMGNGRIPGFPARKVKEFCATGDPVCGHPTGGGGGGMGMGHVGYGSSAAQAAKFLVGRIHAAGEHGAGGAAAAGKAGDGGAAGPPKPDAAGSAVVPDSTKGGGGAGAAAAGAAVPSDASGGAVAGVTSTDSASVGGANVGAAPAAPAAAPPDSTGGGVTPDASGGGGGGG